MALTPDEYWQVRQGELDAALAAFEQRAGGTAAPILVIATGSAASPKVSIILRKSDGALAALPHVLMRASRDYDLASHWAALAAANRAAAVPATHSTCGSGSRAAGPAAEIEAQLSETLERVGSVLLPEAPMALSFTGNRPGRSSCRWTIVGTFGVRPIAPSLPGHAKRWFAGGPFRAPAGAVGAGPRPARAAPVGIELLDSEAFAPSTDATLEEIKGAVTRVAARWGLSLETYLADD